MMTSNGNLLWEDEKDETPITLGIFSKPNLHENDPLAGDHDLEDPLEENRPNQTVEIGFGGRTRSSSRVKVATPTKTPVLSNPPPATSVSSTNLIPSYINKKAFTAEMDKNVACIIDESIGLFGLDPRGYHPFYLRIYKYIDIGLKNKHIKSFKDIKSYWEKYDRICKARLEKPKAKTTFTGIESPYATYIKTGKVMVNGKEVNLKRNEAEIKKRFMELEKSAKDIVNKWKNKGQSKSILDDLTTRLQFLNHCKSITFPADCVEMNKLWHKFLYEYSQPTNTPHVEVKGTDEANDLNARPVLVPKIKFQETSSVVDVEIIAPDEDDCRSKMELDVDDKSQPISISQANSSNSAKRGRKQTEIEMTEFNLPVIKINKNVEVKRNNEANDLKLPIVLVRKLSLQTITKYQKSSADDVEIIELDDEDDRQGQIELDFPPMEDVLMDVEYVDEKSNSISATNPSESAKQRSERETEMEMTESNLPVIVTIQIKNIVISGESHLTSSVKSEKPSIKTKGKSKIGAGRLRLKSKQEQKKRFKVFKLSQLKVTHALKKLKLRRKGSAFDKKRAKLENMICSGPYFSKVKSSFKKKQSLKKESSPSPSSYVPDESMEGAQISPPVVVKDLDKNIGNTVTDQTSIDKSIECAPTQPKNQKFKKQNQREICDICGKVYHQGSSIKLHKFYLHGVFYVDPQVQQFTAPIGNRNQPMKKGRVACDICGLVMTSAKPKASLRYHKKSKHQPNRIRKKTKCPICLEEFWLLWLHFQEVHIQGVEGLEKGTKNSNDNGVLIEPPKPSEYNKKSSAPSICEICGIHFRKKCELNRHMEQIHETEGKPFLCQECPKQFKFKDSLGAHMRQAHHGKDNRCDICSRVMQTSGKLWKHKVDVHGMSELEPPPGVTLMQCEYCGDKILRNMLQHIQKNHPEQVEKYRHQRKKNLAGPKQWEKKIYERRRREAKEWKATGKGPSYLRNMEIRRMKYMGVTNSWKCPTPNCRKHFLNNSTFESHLRNDHCSEKNLIKTLEEIQLVKITPTETWNCAVCDQNMGCIDEVNVHFTFQHQQTLKKLRDNNLIFSANIIEALYCPHCREKLDTDQALRDHVEGGHPNMCFKCPECEWLVISPKDLQEHFMLEHTDPNPIKEWVKQKDNPKAIPDSKMKEGKTGVMTRKPVKKLKERRPQPTTRPTRRGRKRRNGSQKLAKCEDLNSESSSENSDSDYDFTRIPQLEPKGASSLPVRRSCRSAKSRYKKATNTATTLANFTDSKLYQCQVYVKRLSKAEISFYCKSSL